MKITYKVEYRNVKYPRLEFRGLVLQVILPNEMKNAKELIEKRNAWIQKKWNIIQEAIKTVKAPNGFMIFGEPYTIENTNILKPIIDYKQRKIQVNPQNPKHQKILKKLLKNILKQKIQKIINEYSEKIGFQLNEIIIRQQKTKWGSCSDKRNITLNLKLVCLPEKIIKYIIYHEITHLKHKRHNQIFWQIVSQEFPDYKQYERKLLEYWFSTEILFEKIINSNLEFQKNNKDKIIRDLLRSSKMAL